MVKGLSEISAENTTAASHGGSLLFGPHLNPGLPTRFLLSVKSACFPRMHLDFQKLVQLKLGPQSRAPTLDINQAFFYCREIVTIFWRGVVVL